ncbi:MAG: adenine deaminase [Marinilabiliales bacterium]|nr:MAG: adenine deaminase [Marinilabiliales bacterium]
MDKKIEGNIVDVLNEKIYPAEIIIAGGKIIGINGTSKNYDRYLMPGFVDSHIHIESSMLTPAQFACLAVKHGTVGVVSDPHEIANVAGKDGIDFMIRNSETVPLKFFFGAPSCVPATGFETSGAILNSQSVSDLLKRRDIWFLSEVMNFPGVLNEDPEVLSKIGASHSLNKPVDGHAPGLRGKQLKKYIKAGISTDHECLTYEEAVEKIRAGMIIQVREGSAARGFDVFSRLFDEFPGSVMMCSDDMHPDDLMEGHINKIVSRGVKKGIDLFRMLRAATVNPVFHYGLPVGLLRVGDPADMIAINSLEDFIVSDSWINGELVYSDGRVNFNASEINIDFPFRKRHIDIDDLKVVARGGNIKVITAFDGQLFTGSCIERANLIEGIAAADPEKDICKIVVVNRYRDIPPAAAFIRGFGLNRGAIAGSVSHDSHNIIAVGASDEEIAAAINRIIDMRGGLVALADGRSEELSLEVGGLMTNSYGSDVSEKYRSVERFAKEMGSTLKSPFMTLSFMALLVIPELKISDKGLFDVSEFSYTDLFCDT